MLLGLVKVGVIFGFIITTVSPLDDWTEFTLWSVSNETYTIGGAYHQSGEWRNATNSNKVIPDKAINNVTFTKFKPGIIFGSSTFGFEGGFTIYDYYKTRPIASIYFTSPFTGKNLVKIFNRDIHASGAVVCWTTTNWPLKGALGDISLFCGKIFT